MSWFNNLSFRYKVLLPIVVFAALIVSMAAFSFISTRDLGKATTNIATHDLAALNYLLQADRDLYQALVAERSMIFVDVESDKFKKLQASHDENVQQAHERVEKFINVANEAGFDRDGGLAKQFGAYRKLRDEWETMTAEVVKQRASNTRTGRNTAIEMSFGNAADKFKAMRSIIDKLSDFMLQRVEQIKQNSQVM